MSTYEMKRLGNTDLIRTPSGNVRIKQHNRICTVEIDFADLKDAEAFLAETRKGFARRSE